MPARGGSRDGHHSERRRMTGRALTVVEDDTVTDADLFTAEQLAALRAAGYGVVGFTTWERILGLEAT